MNAFFRMAFQGRLGTGEGAIALTNRTIAGIDTGGCVYRGHYNREPNGDLVGSVELEVPAGSTLVTGKVFPTGGKFDIPLRVQPNELHGHALHLQTPYGPITAHLVKVADL
jgi:hypothetical protein